MIFWDKLYLDRWDSWPPWVYRDSYQKCCANTDGDTWTIFVFLHRQFSFEWCFYHNIENVTTKAGVPTLDTSRSSHRIFECSKENDLTNHTIKKFNLEGRSWQIVYTIWSETWYCSDLSSETRATSNWNGCLSCFFVRRCFRLTLCAFEFLYTRNWLISVAYNKSYQS